MLVDKGNGLEEGVVYGLRSPSVGEIIAKVVSVNDTEVVVQQPLQLVQMQEGAGLVPAFPMADEDKPVVIPRNNLLYYPVNSDVEAGYSSSTSGLVVPKNQGIIT